MRAFAPLILDMSVVEWSKHRQQTPQKLKASLDVEFEYVGNPLSDRGFRNAVKRYLKCEHSHLKKLFVAGQGQGEGEDKEEDCPVHVDPDQWKQLKKYWSGEVVMKKSQMMTTVRQQVQNVSKLGWRGKAL